MKRSDFYLYEAMHYMSLSFRGYLLAAAAILFLFTYTVPRPALAEDSSWQSLVNQYGESIKRGDVEQALNIATQAMLLAEFAPNRDEKKIAISLYILGDTHAKLGHWDNSLPHLERLLAISEKNSGLEHPDNTQILNALAAIHNQLAQYERAIPLLQRALLISERSRGPEHPETARSLNNLGKTYGETGQYELALPLLQRALAIAEKTSGPEHPDTAWVVGNLGSLYDAFAQYEKALQFTRRALEIREKALGNDHPLTAESLINLASTYTNLAQHDKALPLEQRALAINERTLGTEHSNTALVLNNLALTHAKLGQFDKALELQEKALSIHEKVLGPDHPNTASVLNNIASTHSALAQYEQALQAEERALGISERVLGPDHPNTASILSNLAITYYKLGKTDAALELLRRALSIREKALGDDHPDTALSLSNLANHYFYSEQYEKALPLLQRAYVIREKTLGTDHPETATTLADIAYAFKGMGQPDLAIAFYKASINAYQSHRERISRIDNQTLQSYTETVEYVYQSLAELLVAQGLLPDAQSVLDMLKENEQFEFIRRSGNADPRLTRIGYNANEQVWMTRYRRIADRLAALGVEEQALQKQVKLGLNAEQKLRQKELVADLLVAKSAFESFLKEMREEFASQGPAKTAEASETSRDALRELQGLIRNVGPDVVLLQYYVTDDKLGMLLTTPGIQLARSSNVSAKDLKRQIAEYRRTLRDPKSDSKKLSQALYQLLVAPVAQDLEQAGAKTVMLSLDGSLRYLPFAALHDGNHYLVQRWNLPIYTSVTKNRLLDAPTTRWRGVGLGVTKAVGQFTALPAVRNEMRSIFKAASNGVLPGEVYLDEAFTAQRFKDMSQRPLQLLHVASHFQFSPGTEIDSFLLLGDGQKLTLGDIRTQNYRFDHLDLLTLSACDTGLGGGRDATGREIEGFGVIAQQQGAKAVLATLWPVADDSTAKLMAEMYRRRQDNKLTKMESLRQAQLSLLEQTRYEHPFYWAPFILMGNWK